MQSVGIVAIALLCGLLPAQPNLNDRVGPVTDQGRLLPTYNLILPAGQSAEMPGRPVHVALNRDEDRLFVKDMGALRVYDALKLTELQTLSSPGGASLTGLAVGEGGRHVYFTNASNGLHQFDQGADGAYSLGRTIELPADSFPCGVALTNGDRTALVCLSKRNALGVVDLGNGKVLREVAVGVAPYEVAVSSDGKTAYVTNMGGRRAKKGERTANSAGAEALIDERGVASSGSVSEVDLTNGKETRQFEVGLQPTAVLLREKDGLLLVANTNGDTVSFIDLKAGKTLTQLNVKTDPKLPFGAMPTAMAQSADGRTVYVANAGSNALAVVDLGSPRKPKVSGFIPTAWFPTSVVAGKSNLFVSNMKGYGSRTVNRPKDKGWNSHDHCGTVQSLPVPDKKAMAEHTKTAKRLARVPQLLKAMELQGKDGKAAPIPAKLGDPSVFKHVIYVIKENRTYDQVLGDMKQGDGDPNLCIFGEAITPNHHAIAREFVLLDNYYCSGVLSADGHSWATEGNVTPYLERAFGGFGRSYTFGDDPLTYSSSGFLWDHVLGAGLSFRNYGEMDYAEPPKGMSVKALLEARARGERTKFVQKIGVDRLRRYSMPDYPGWNMEIPDAVRMDRFQEEFKQYQRDGGLPNLCIVYLPQDHTGGSVTARAHVADNDQAIGRLVQMISHSDYWKDTVIFINEDDPQNGFDHVDGHRSLCLVASAYTRRGAVVSDFCNQASVLRTILHIFGLPPMNQHEAMAPLMSGCFTEKPDFTPYDLKPATVALDETHPPKSSMSPVQRYWAQMLASIPMERTGMKTEAHDDLFNRALWFEMRGDAPYPARFAGPHGRGLKSRGLAHIEDD